MQNPFESGHVKNYILLYVSVVVIMVLFFIASTLFHEVGSVDKRVFNTNISEVPHAEMEVKIMKNVSEVNGSKFKLMPKSY